MFFILKINIPIIVYRLRIQLSYYLQQPVKIALIIIAEPALGIKDKSFLLEDLFERHLVKIKLVYLLTLLKFDIITYYYAYLSILICPFRHTIMSRITFIELT